MAFVTPVVEHWMEREIAQWVHSMKDRSNEPSHHQRTLLPRSYILLHDLNFFYEDSALQDIKDEQIYQIFIYFINKTWDIKG